MSSLELVDSSIAPRMVVPPKELASALAVADDEILEQFRPPSNTLFLHPGQLEVYNSKKRFRVVVAGRRWGKCLHSGSMVEMADGTKKPIEQIIPGDVVLALNEDNYRLYHRKVVAVEDNGVKELVEIKTSQRTLKSTPHHPILANNRWIDAGELKVGDLVAVPKGFSGLKESEFLPIGHEEFRKHLESVSGELSPTDLNALQDAQVLNPSHLSSERFKALVERSNGFYDPLLNADLVWEVVTDVKSAETGQTWDLSVEGNHNFIANGIVVHNTQLAKVSLIKFARVAKRLIWYVAPSYRMAKQIMWPELVEAIPRGWVKKYNETVLTITLVNGSRIELKGADSPDTLRGVGIHFLVMDEVQDIDPEAWKKVLRPTLASTGGHAMFIGTPKAYNFLHELWSAGQNVANAAWDSWQFPTITSPFIPKSEIEAAQRDMDEKSYKQEFLASFESMSGRVYYPFDRNIHVKPLEFNPELPIWIGQDFNIDPMSSVVFQKQKNGEIWAVDEICLLSSNTFELCDELERRYWRYLDQIVIYPDPAGAYRGHQRGESDLDIFRERGFKKQKYRKKHPPVADRVNSVNRMLQAANGSVRLFVDPKCKKFIEALEQTQYVPGSREVDKKAGVEHAADAAGYCIEFEFPVRKVEVLGISI